MGPTLSPDAKMGNSNPLPKNTSWRQVQNSDAEIGPIEN